VAQVLRLVYLEGRVTLKDLPRESGLPIPVLAAVRRELESAYMLERSGGLVLTERGCRFVESCLGITTKHDPVCPMCDGRRSDTPPWISFPAARWITTPGDFAPVDVGGFSGFRLDV
jgi:predicted methyltransferase